MHLPRKQVHWALVSVRAEVDSPRGWGVTPAFEKDSPRGLGLQM